MTLKVGDRVEVVYTRAPVGGAPPTKEIIYRGTLRGWTKTGLGYVQLDNAPGSTGTLAFAPDRIRPLPVLERLSEI